METVTSRDNSLLRQARLARDGKADELMFVEGLRLCEEVLRSELFIAAVIVSDELARKAKASSFIARLEKASERAVTVNEKLLESISYTRTPQGIVVLAARPKDNEAHFGRNQNQDPLIVVMHRLNNPVNVGAILRTSEAAGATGAIATQSTTDPFSPKSLRGAMGSAFRLPIWFGPSYEDALAWCSTRQIQTICADVHSDVSYDQVDWRQASALILGQESSGLSPEEIALADHAVKIPMREQAESLNVAVAAGVLLYEAARVRR